MIAAPDGPVRVSVETIVAVADSHSEEKTVVVITLLAPPVVTVMVDVGQGPTELHCPVTVTDSVEVDTCVKVPPEH